MNGGSHAIAPKEVGAEIIVALEKPDELVAKVAGIHAIGEYFLPDKQEGRGQVI
jgi:hypothetical protein